VTAGINIRRVTNWLVDSVDLLPPLKFNRVGHGQSNFTYRVTDARGRPVVLRRPPLGTLARGAHDMEREHRILLALAGQPVPTPQPLAITTDIAVTGAPIYVMEHVDGIVAHSASSTDDLDLDARARVGIAAAEALAALHHVDFCEAGLDALARHDGYAERQLRGWSRQWEATRTRALPNIDRTARVLRASIPPQRDVTIAHGDYNLANLILAPSGDVRAILDWELCTLGDPVADLGTLLCYWPDRPDQALQERDPVPLQPGFVRRADMVRAYAQAAPERDLSGLEFWVALATWRLAIIIEGVMRRRLANVSNSHSSADALRRTTDHLAASAASLVGA
jgi:aminoglycoside phosphotransferase (APT) family kinase protein